MKKIRKAVIPAAGWGTRSLPAAKAIPKEMLPVVGKPAIQYIIEEAAASGITEILIITSRSKHGIEDHFDRNRELEYELEKKGKKEILDKIFLPASLANIYYTRQQEQKGLGHAVLCAKEFVGDENFAVLLPDDLIVHNIPCLKQMVNMYKKKPSSIIAVTEVSEAEVSRYGIVDTLKIEPGFFVVRDLVEKPSPDKAPSNLGIVGRYIIEPEIFGYLQEVKPGAGGEIQLTDALRLLAADKAIYAYQFQGRRFDVGDTAGFLRANICLGLEDPIYGPELKKEVLGLAEPADYQKFTKGESRKT